MSWRAGDVGSSRCWREACSVAGVGASAGLPGFDGVVEHDAVVVVHNLGLVAELDRLAEAALGDRPDVPGRAG